MHYYKDADSQVWAYDDGQEVKAGLTPITEAEANALRFPPPTPEELAERRRAEILRQLDALDAAQINLRTFVNAFLGDTEATAILTAKMAAHEAVAAPLRAELITLPAN
jgi:hypothetical protein